MSKMELLAKIELLNKYEAMLEELKAMPWQAVYDYFCETAGKPVGGSVMQAIRKYENDVQSKRG